MESHIHRFNTFQNLKYNDYYVDNRPMYNEKKKSLIILILLSRYSFIVKINKKINSIIKIDHEVEWMQSNIF